MNRPKVIDEFSHLEGIISRQRIAQMRHKRDGLCMFCSRPLKTALHCEVHARSLSERTKARGLKAVAVKQEKRKTMPEIGKLERRLEDLLVKLTPAQKAEYQWYITARIKRGIKVTTLIRLDAALAASL
jgi:hypothetical protein